MADLDFMVPPALPKRGLGFVRLNDRWGAAAAWIVILGVVVLAMFRAEQSATQREEFRREAGNSSEPKTIPAHLLNPQLTPQGKAVFATNLVFGSNPLAGAALRDATVTSAERVWVIPILVEIQGKAAGLAELETLSAAPASMPSSTQPAPISHPAPSQVSGDIEGSAMSRDLKALRQIYSLGPDSLDASARDRLVRRLGWSGELALQYGKPDVDPERQALVSDAKRFLGVTYGITILGGIGLVAGIVLLVLTIVQLAAGRLRTTYSSTARPSATSEWLVKTCEPAGLSGFTQSMTGDVAISNPPTLPKGAFLPPLSFTLAGTSPLTAAAGANPSDARIFSHWARIGSANGRTAPFLEAFAIYLLLYLLFGYLLVGVAGIDRNWAQWLAFAAVPLAMAWPRLRGVTIADWKRGFGWNSGRGVLREMGAGVLAYVTGLPLVALAMVLSVLLSKLSKSTPHHPINDEVANGGTWALVQIVVLAAVVAPIVEETFFRGALFHHLRTGFGWVLSSLVSSVIFAAVHPQGWAFIPILGSLAIVFCGMREWRTSSIASMTAHGIHNGVVVTIAILGAT